MVSWTVGIFFNAKIMGAILMASGRVPKTQHILYILSVIIIPVHFFIEIDHQTNHYQNNK